MAGKVIIHMHDAGRPNGPDDPGNQEYERLRRVAADKVDAAVSAVRTFVNRDNPNANKVLQLLKQAATIINDEF